MTSEETQIRYFSRMMSDVSNVSSPLPDRLVALAELVNSVDRDQVFWKTHHTFVKLTPIKFRQLCRELEPYSQQSDYSHWIQQIMSELTRVANVYEKLI